jgi:hypothetical protein
MRSYDADFHNIKQKLVGIVRCFKFGAEKTVYFNVEL